MIPALTEPGAAAASFARLGASQGLRRLCIAATLVGGVLAVAVLAAWQIPQHLDWSRYRGAISAFAAGQLGQPVTIGGSVHLSLLPQAVLIASDVTLGSGRDGVSARLGTLRLQVGLGPLLQGKFVPRDLVLDNPVLALPWPLPAAGAASLQASGLGAPLLRAHVAPGFAARVEGGTIRIGGVAVTGIDATLHADAETGALGAEGSGLSMGQKWHFTAVLGAPAFDGAASLDLAVHARGGAPVAGGIFRGRLLGSGAVEGAVSLAGPDLSALLPSPRMPWAADGRVNAAAGRLTAPDLHLTFGRSAATGSASISLSPKLRADVALVTEQLDFAGWAGLLSRGPGLPIETHLDLRAANAAASGGTLHDVHAVLALNPGETVVEAAGALLPGHARVELQGRATTGPGDETSFEGPVTIDAPDLHATLEWLAPAGAAGLPPTALRQLAARALLRVAGSGMTATNIDGTLDGSRMLGAARLVSTPPGGTATLNLDRLVLDDWFGVAKAAPALVAAAGLPDLDLQLSVKSAPCAGLALTDLQLDGHAGPDGLVLRRLEADLPGGHAQAAGTLGRNLSLAGVRLNVTAADAAKVYAALPAAWQVLPRLWQGGLNLAMSAAGPSAAIALQIRADFGDLRAEADGTLNLPARAATATLTLRHPGTPRLLQALGVAGAEPWVDDGAMALVAHGAASPGHAAIADFSLEAAALQLHGALDFDLTAPTPWVTGHMTAASLALPGDPLGPGWTAPPELLAGFRADVRLDAAEVFAGLHRIATQARADIGVAGGVLHAGGVSAAVAGGVLRGDAAVDAGQSPPLMAVQATLGGASLDGLALHLPVRLAGGTLDLALDGVSSGQSAQTLLANAAGEVSGAVQGVQADGFDLARIARLFATRAPKPRGALAAALAGGSTAPLAGAFDAMLDHGRATVRSANFGGPSGGVSVTGSVGIAGGADDLVLQLRAAAPLAPVMTMSLGPKQRLPKQRLGDQRPPRPRL